MNKAIVNLVTDVMATLLFLAMVVTGFILRFPLPPGTNKSLTLWSLSRHEWGTIHFWFSAGFLVILFVHLILHWHWVVTMISKKLFGVTSAHQSFLRAGLITVVSLAAVFILFAWVSFRGVDKITTSEEGDCPPSEQSPEIEQTSKTSMTVSQQPQIDFWKEIYPILQINCISCHGPRKQLAGFRADKRDDYFNKNNGHPLVVPFKSKESSLIEIISGTKKDWQAADVHLLSEQEIVVIKKWIDEGAGWP